MPDSLLTAGEAEVFKATIHLGIFAATCLCYGAMAYSQRRERRLALSALVYGGLTWFEFRQIQRHLNV
jgi:hypothetical protein